MYSYIIAGMTGQGKSRTVFSMLRKPDVNCLVFDVNNEYGVHPKNKDWSLNLSTNNKEKRSRYTGCDVKEFMNIVYNKRNTICVFEEATGFFKGQVGRELTRLVIGKRHTGNVFVFLFHSIRAIPPELLDWTNFIILYKTGDSITLVEKKHERLIAPWIKAQQNPNGVPVAITWMQQ